MIKIIGTKEELQEFKELIKLCDDFAWGNCDQVGKCKGCFYSDYEFIEED